MYFIPCTLYILYTYGTAICTIRVWYIRICHTYTVFTICAWLYHICITNPAILVALDTFHRIYVNIYLHTWGHGTMFLHLYSSYIVAMLVMYGRLRRGNYFLQVRITITYVRISKSNSLNLHITHEIK